MQASLKYFVLFIVTVYLIFMNMIGSKKPDIFCSIRFFSVLNFLRRLRLSNQTANFIVWNLDPDSRKLKLMPKPDPNGKIS